jgi:small subunit ribosomal protein S6
MRDYELLYIISGDESEEGTAAATDAVNAAVATAGGKVTEENLWGRRRLAYPIQKQEHGWYVVTRFSLELEQLNPLQQELNLHSKLLRTVLLKASEVPSAEEAAKADEAVSEAEAKAAKGKETGARPSREKAPEPVIEPTAVKAKPAPAPEPAKAPVKAAAEKPKTPKKETATEKKARQAVLDEKLSKILNEEEHG